MKTAGFLLLQLSALLYSIQRIKAKNREAESLRSFCAMLEQLRGALKSEAAPMPELLQALSRRSDGAARVFLDRLTLSMDRLGTYSFHELWDRALSEGDSVPDADASQALRELGAVLGRYELEIQLRAAADCHRTLLRQLEKLREGIPSAKRLTLGLSLSAALLLGIILI